MQNYGFSPYFHTRRTNCETCVQIVNSNTMEGNKYLYCQCSIALDTLKTGQSLGHHGPWRLAGELRPHLADHLLACVNLEMKKETVIFCKKKKKISLWYKLYPYPSLHAFHPVSRVLLLPPASPDLASHGGHHGLRVPGDEAVPGADGVHDVGGGHRGRVH